MNKEIRKKMATQRELIARGDSLAEKYNEEELKKALKDALFVGDGEERLAIQWALKKVTNTTDGHKFTREAEEESKKKLEA